MSKPVEFGSFYKLLQSVKEGEEEKIKELEWMLAEYEHAKEAKSAYDELGQIFCHHGIMELYEYTGLEDLKVISSLNETIWNYLKLRTNYTLTDYMIKSMLDHAQKHNLTSKMAEKWEISNEDINSNIDDLAKYVVEGIIEIIN